MKKDDEETQITNELKNCQNIYFIILEQKKNSIVI
jgi:hypothetical protein